MSNIAEVQNSIMDELNNLTFVKDNAQKLMERKVSFERRDKKTTVRKREKSKDIMCNFSMQSALMRSLISRVNIIDLR